MERLSKKIVSLVVTVMMLASAFLIPGVFNFSSVNAEEATLELEVQFSNASSSGNNSAGLISTFSPSANWVLTESNGVFTLTNAIAGIVIEFSNIEIKTGNEDSVLDVKVTTGDDVESIDAVFAQSRSGNEKHELEVEFINGVSKTVTLKHKLNFLDMTFNLVVDDDPESELFTITYISNHEIITIDAQQFEAGATIEEPTPSDDSLEFKGWFSDPDFETQFTGFSSMPAQDVTVYALWEIIDNDEPQPDLYNVIYFVWNDELGEFEEVNRDAYEEGQSIVRFDVDGRDGFIFDGWYTMAQPIFTLNVENMDNQDFVELPILIDDRMNLIPFDFDGAVMGTSDIELYGRFVQVVAPIEFVIDFIIVGETNELLESRTFDFEEGFGEIPAPTQEGFTFTGWFTNEELTNPADFDTLLNAEVLEYTVYGSWVMNEVEDEDEEDEIIDDEVDEDDEGDVDGDEDEDDETVDEETTEEEATEEETVVEDDGDVLGDSDEFVEEEKTTEELEDEGEVLGDSDEKEEEVEETTEETELEDEGEVLGDSDQLPEMNDTNYAAIALFFLIIGLLTLVATKQEEEVI